MPGPAVSTTWPETNEGPLVAVPPRMIASGSVIAGRSRTITFHTIRSAASFVNVTSAAATASRHRRNRSATITDDRPDRERAQELHPVGDGLERTGHPVDGLEDGALDRGDRAVAHDDRADQEDAEARQADDRRRCGGG